MGITKLQTPLEPAEEYENLNLGKLKIYFQNIKINFQAEF